MAKASFVGCEPCHTAVPTPDVNVGLFSDEGIQQVLELLGRLGCSLRDWPGNPYVN